MQVLLDSDGWDHNCVHLLMGLHWPGHSWVFNSDFSLIMFWGGFIMRFHDVYLFCVVLKLECFATFVASGAGLLVLVGIMSRALLSVLSQYFKHF